MNKRSIVYGVCLLLTIVGWLNVTLLSDHRLSHSTIAPVVAAQAPTPDWDRTSSLNVPGSPVQSAIPLLANGQIAFTSDRNGNREIYVMNADGTNQVRLTSNSSPDDYPTWSPDGMKIAFVSQGASGGFFYLSVMNADGTNKVELTPIRNFRTQPAEFTDSWSMSWSPDGNRIAFQETARIFVVNADGSNRQRLTEEFESEFEPSWSPDGSKILFSSIRGAVRYPTLYTVKPDGTELRAFPGFDGNWETAPNWSPSGDKVLFVTDYTGDNFIPVSVIFTANADGTNRQRFDGDGELAYRNKPNWSPDGSKIIFDKWENSSGDMEIYVKNIDGSGFAQLTNTNGWNFHPSWQPFPVRVIPRRPSLPREPIIRRGGAL